ncbi:MAG: T9SS type A sorting domain-containing protein [Bacteroidetes bacterium]|nr:T9SS type A sorting domain-containing protein [Bacteroidota bacterium]
MRRLIPSSLLLLISVASFAGNDVLLNFSQPPDSAVYDIFFEVDLFNAINTNGFDPATDTVVVRAGYAGSSGEIQELTLKAPLFGTVYTGTMEDFAGIENKYVAYKYYKVNGNLDQEEFYFDNFDETGTITGSAYRKILTPDEKSGTLNASDLLEDAVSSHRMPYFRNTNPVGVATSLVIKVDMSMAINFLENLNGTLDDVSGGSLVITKANYKEYPIYINGPATGGWVPWNQDSLGENRRMSDDGTTKGDEVAGDSIWTITLTYEASDFSGQEYKFSIGGADNEAGNGNHHLTNLAAKEVNTVTNWFGDIEPSRYNAVADQNPGAPHEVRLLPNYPNPFNPSTMIPFTVAKAGIVNFTVYNVLGQVVSTFNYDAKSAGLHSVNFQANNLATGSYLVKMTAGNFNKTIKMVFAK